ncbi:TetR/AcrR family transcriptional regulator [Rhizobium glycinendophyticum]|nr:TetR/AcrR family transcriptional regulator [Rhizobium glycinendophyticum]
MPISKQVFARKSAQQTRSVYTVDCIVEAAARILEEGRLEHYNTNTIAERAGVSVGSLYQYFPNKDAITAELWRRSGAILVEDVVTASHHQDWRLAIIGMAEAAVRHQLQRPDLAVLLDRQQHHFESAELDRPASCTILRCIEHVLVSSKMPLHHSARIMASDLFSITRSLCDNASAASERDSGSLLSRICHAVFGYMRVDESDFAYLDRHLIAPTRAVP